MTEAACDHKTWRVRQIDSAAENELVGSLPVSPILCRILLNRGISTRREVDRFLDAGLQDLHDPYLLDGMKEAIARTRQALERHEKIMVHGDYDVDGVTGTALLVRVFRILKADVTSYLPHRQREGYGMSRQAVDAAKKSGVTLIITVDCGSCAVEEIEYAVSLGMDVIVTDHHEVGTTLPPALTIVNPIKLGCDYPFKGLAGVGVAFKFAEALVRECGYDVSAFRQRFCDLAAIGTVGDIVPLLDENRILVKHGLQEIPRTGKKGITALLNVAGANGPRGIGAGRPITSYTLAYGLAPRLNAAGRIDDADLALQLLLTMDDSEAFRLAKALESHNKQRQAEQERITNEAIELALRSLGEGGSKVLVLSSQGWHPGIVGIVASKVTDRFSRPSILVAIDEEGTAGVGSARSISAFNIHDALLACGHLLQRCGGHARAAGLSIEMAKLPEFGLAINEIADGILTDSDLQPQLDVDAELELDSVTSDLAYELQLLEPYGCGNPEPVFLSRRVMVLDKMRMGASRTHLRLKLASSGRPISPSPHPPLPLECVAFGWGERESTFRIGTLVDVCYNIQINHFNGQERVQMMLRDARPSDASFGDAVSPHVA